MSDTTGSATPAPTDPEGPTERPQASSITSNGCAPGSWARILVSDTDISKSSPDPSFAKAFTERNGAKLDKLLKDDGKTGREWYRGKNAVEAKALKSFMSDVFAAFSHDERLRHDTPSADWLEIVRRRELDTLLNPEMAASVSAGGPAFCFGVSSLAYSMATGDSQRVSEIYEGLSRNHTVKLSDLIDYDTEHNKSDFLTAVAGIVTRLRRSPLYSDNANRCSKDRLAGPSRLDQYACLVRCAARM